MSGSMYGGFYRNSLDVFVGMIRSVGAESGGAVRIWGYQELP